MLPQRFILITSRLVYGYDIIVSVFIVFESLCMSVDVVKYVRTFVTCPIKFILATFVFNLLVSESA